MTDICTIRISAELPKPGRIDKLAGGEMMTTHIISVDGKSLCDVCAYSSSKGECYIRDTGTAAKVFCCDGFRQYPIEYFDNPKEQVAR